MSRWEKPCRNLSFWDFHRFAFMKVPCDRTLTGLSLFIFAVALVHLATLIDFKGNAGILRSSYEWGYVGESVAIGKFRILPVSGRSIRAAVATPER